MNKAFTLIELIIVLAIMSISTGAGYVTYIRSVQANTLKKDSEDFASVLTTARERAVRNDKSGNPACADLRGYDVLFSTATLPHRYQIRLRCAGSPDTYTLLTPQYTLTNTNFYGVANGSTVNFFEPYGCLDPTCSTGASTIKIQSPNETNKCIWITLNPLGVITVGDPGVCI